MDTAPIVNSLPALITLLENVRRDKRLVCTIGSWDILHQGHTDYLKGARALGDILVVGVDSDVAYERHKKKLSMYPQSDRQSILSSLRYVDYVTIVEDVDMTGEWHMELIKLVKPDAFVCNDRSYPDDQIKRIRKLCPVKLLPFADPPASSSSVAVADELKRTVLRERKIKITMRVVAFYLLVVLLALSILTTLAMVFFQAFVITKLPSYILETLILKTIPEAFALGIIVFKYLFPAKD